jgi:ornithine cyclodeaminase
MTECIDLVAQGLEALARGDAYNPLRWAMWLPDKSGLLGMMPGYTAEPRTLGIKVVAVFPGNHGGPYDSHQGLVVLFDGDNGVPVAIMDASEITAIRTAAASGVATRLLAREDAADLAIIGSGVQARTHLEAMIAVRPILRARVHSKTPDNSRRFAETATSRHGIDVRVAEDAREAVEGAAIVCTTTSSRQPVLLGEWLAPGVHVNAVGSSLPTARELDASAMAKARLFVDRRESTINESGDYLMANKEGAIDETHILAELGELLSGAAEGRRAHDEITLFKSLGLAIEDLVAARYVWQRAEAEGVGVTAGLGGLRIAE